MKQRIEHACMLIKQNELPLAEIAFLCGYTSYNGFLSAFKGYTGKAPKEYEKSIR
jgi:AraC-like DNA-binding protein